jgi:hypothetical protein
VCLLKIADACNTVMLAIVNVLAHLILSHGTIRESSDTIAVN